jgi:nucleotide-binding universal stress UspA family protein
MTALRPEQPIVVVPIGHTAGQPQLQAAEEYARGMHGDVLLVHVLARPDARREAAAQAYLDTLVEYLASRCIRARALVRTGNLARTLVAEAQCAGAAAIVLGVSRPPALLSGLIGGVSTAIARAAVCPVVLVQRPRNADPEPALWDFGDAVKRAGQLWQRPARSTTVDVACIVGSVYRASELGADFRPHRGARRKLDDQRLDGIRRAIDRGRAQSTYIRSALASTSWTGTTESPPRSCSGKWRSTPTWWSTRRDMLAARDSTRPTRRVG